MYLAAFVINDGKAQWLPGMFDTDLYGAVQLGWFWYKERDVRSCVPPAVDPVLIGRLTIPNVVPVNQETVIQGDVPTPQMPGRYVLMLRMVKEKVAWFDEVGDSPVVCVAMKVRNSIL